MAPALLHASLAADRYLIDGYLERLLEDELALGKGAVPQAMRYGVLGPAQRIRPILSIRLARVFDTPLEAVIPLGAAVELLHCASLIVDDLPCMDDSSFRRNKPAVHIQFGEATSVLAAFGLVALAARTVVDRGSTRDSAERLLGFQIQLLRSMDCSGLIGGQALDLQFTRHVSLPGAFDISELKTVPLFRLAVSAGAFFADLHSNEEALLNCFGHEFGLAFQITDDLLDGESRQRTILDEKLSTLRAVIAPFGHRRSHLEELIDFLDRRVSGGPQE